MHKGIENEIHEFMQNRDFPSYVAALSNDQARLKHLFNYLEENVNQTAIYIAWILIHYSKKHPLWIDETIQKNLIKKVIETENLSLKRNCLCVLTQAKNSFSEEGVFLDYCYQLLSNIQNPPAIKLYAFEIIENKFLQQFPELFQELQEVVLNFEGNNGIYGALKKRVNALAKVYST